MRLLPHLLAQSALWSLAPILDETGALDSPSLLVMPLVAVLAVLAARDWRWGLALPAAGLAVVLLGFSGWTLATGRAGLAEALAFAAAAVPFHLVGTWVLIGLLWWPGRKVRSLALARGAA